MFHITRSKIVAGAAVALLGVYSAVAGFAAPGDTGVAVDSPACVDDGCTEVDIPGGHSSNLPITAADGIAGAEPNRPDGVPLGPPEGVPLGPPEGDPLGPQGEGRAVGQPDDRPVGPPEGSPLGPSLDPSDGPSHGQPDGRPVGRPDDRPGGPQDGFPSIDTEDEDGEEEDEGEEEEEEEGKETE